MKYPPSACPEHPAGCAARPRPPRPPQARRRCLLRTACRQASCTSETDACIAAAPAAAVYAHLVLAQVAAFLRKQLVTVGAAVGATLLYTGITAGCAAGCKKFFGAVSALCLLSHGSSAHWLRQSSAQDSCILPAAIHPRNSASHSRCASHSSLFSWLMIHSRFSSPSVRFSSVSGAGFSLS